MLVLSSLFVSLVTGLTLRQSSAPSVTIKNGTVIGIYSTEYNQDFFLGVPFVQPPVGNLRFRMPVPINTTWSEPIQATKYYPECVGYGGDQIGYNISEDCLGLNIVRPSGHEGQSLPVAVWIHGGGFVMGGSSDLRYNLSFIVEQSVKIGKPIIGVSIPYRLSGWGFLDSKEVRNENATNLGMHDQRAALYWLQENIQSFGGDPSKVTIWGESAGGLAVGIHLIAYGGRDDKLFAGAISESGNSVLSGAGFYTVEDNAQPQYANITKVTGCSNATDTLQCLRELDFATLNAAFNISGPGYRFGPVNDGNLIQGSQVDQLNEGKFIKVPYLTGSNTDEGVSFGPKGINNDTAFEDYLRKTPGKIPLDNATTKALAAVYPNIPAYLDVIHDVPLDYSWNTTYGTQFRRADAFGGDFAFAAVRRLTCQNWSKYNVSSFCYRFDIRPFPVTPPFGVPHFQEVAFVFNNVKGVGYIPPISYPPFTNLSSQYIREADLISKMWASFVADGNPNGHGVSGYQEWPVYDTQSNGGVGESYLFSVNETSRTELDNYRAPGIALLNSLWKTAYGK